MRVSVLSIPVLDQEVALKFYTEKLGFIKKLDIPLGGEDRWLTLVSEEDQEGTEVLLEPAPLHFGPSKVYQNALFEAGMPVTQFDVDNVQQEYDRLVALEVRFKTKPKDVGTAIIAIFDDTCGNYIQIVESK